MGTTTIYKTSYYVRWDAKGDVLTQSKSIGNTYTPPANGGLDGGGVAGQVGFWLDNNTLVGDEGLTYEVDSSGVGTLGVGNITGIGDSAGENTELYITGDYVDINGICINSNLIDAQDGVTKHLTITAGDAVGSAGTDAGNLILKAGDAIYGDTLSQAGKLCLVPSLPYNTPSAGYIYFGDTSYPGVSIGLLATGVEDNIGLFIFPKGSGMLDIGSDTGFVTLHGSTSAQGIIYASNDITFLGLRDSTLTGTNGSVGVGYEDGYDLIIKGGSGTLTGSELSVSDDFQAYSTGELGGQGDWIACLYDGNIVNTSGDKRIGADSGGNDFCVKLNQAFSNNHRAKITIDVVSTNYIGVAARVSGSGATVNYYAYYANNARAYLVVFKDGIGYVAFAVGDLVSAGDTLEIVVDGTSLKCYHNDVLDSTLGALEGDGCTDTGTGGDYTIVSSTIPAGLPGICGEESGTTTGDLFIAEDLDFANGDGGNLYLYAGAGGIIGKIYLGTGSTGTYALEGSGTGTSVLLYNRTTGQVTYGDMGEGGGGGVSLSGSTNNTICTVTGANAIIGEANLTFDGSDLTASAGDMYADDFIQNSDRRLKTNIESYKPEYLDIDYKQFEFKSDPDHIHYGVIAQEILKVCPELVFERTDGMLAVASMDLLFREIAYLKEEIKQLKNGN